MQCTQSRFLATVRLGFCKHCQIGLLDINNIECQGLRQLKLFNVTVCHSIIHCAILEHAQLYSSVIVLCYTVLNSALLYYA